MARSSLALTQSLLGPLGIARPSRKSGRSHISLVGTPTVARGILPAENAVTITAVSGVNYLGAMTITGLNFGSVVGTVTVGGILQTIGSWTNTSITINSLNCVGLFYGVAVSLIVTSSGGQSGTHLLTSGVFPQTGWNYITLTSVNPTSAWRLTSTPDLAIGNQITWGNINTSGTVTVNADATFEANALAQFFYFYVNDGTGWGPQALVTVVVALLYTDLYVFIAQLINAGMMVQPNVNWITSSTVPYGEVISVVPVGGSVVNLWTYVTINASLGPAAGTTLNLVPNVIGQQAYDAERSCWNAQLDVGQRIYAFSNTVAAGYIIAQSVASGTLQPPGTSIQLTVSLGAQSTPTTTTIVPTILTH